MKQYSVLIGLWMCVLVCGCDRAAGPVQGSGVQTSPQAVQALVPQALNVIKEGLDHPNSYIRTAAIEITAQTRQDMFLPRLMQLADDSKVTVRFAALVAMGDMQCTSCRPTLLKKLEDPNPNVRIAAAYGLFRIGVLEYRVRVLEALKNPNPTVAANAALLVGKMGKREDLPLLWELMTAGNPNEKVLFQAVESMARLQDPKVYRDKIWPLLISKYHDDRLWGIRCMGALGTPDAQTAIQTMLQDDVLEVRLAAAEQLGALEDRSGLYVVQDYFGRRPNLDETTVANQLAVSAIGTLREPSLNGHLSKALSSKSPIVRLMAAKSVLLQKQSL
ncbi:MAG: HEAT repeat domain-containing protein [Anaerohalosphaeraceae bacterium]